MWNRKKTTLFSGHYLCNRSTLDTGVLGYIGILNIRNTLPKSGTFLLGHPVYNGLLEMREEMHAKCPLFIILIYVLNKTEMYVQMSVKPPIWNFMKITSLVLQV
jgi:hypothetical protein